MEFVYFIPYFVPLAVLFIGIEIYISVKHNENLYDFKDSSASAAIGLGAVLLQILTKAGTLAVFYFFYEIGEPIRRLLGYENLGWSIGAWVAALILDDFCFYWHHRFSHRIRVLWAAHIVHHSSEYFNLGTSFRNGWVIFFYKPVFWLWMPFIGFHPVMVLTAMAINTSYQFWLHTQKISSLGWIEKIFNTPHLHQIHHSQNTEYIDKNFGGILMIWDRLFGTYHPGIKGGRLQFGVTTPPGSFHPIKIVTHEYESIWKDLRQTKDWSTRFKILFQPPGWSPRPPEQTAKPGSAGVQMKEKAPAAPSALKAKTYLPPTSSSKS